MSEQKRVVTKWLRLEVPLNVRQDPKYGQNVPILYGNKLDELSKAIGGERLRRAEVRDDDALVLNRRKFILHPLFKLVYVMTALYGQPHYVSRIPLRMEVKKRLPNARLA